MGCDKAGCLCVPEGVIGENVRFQTRRFLLGQGGMTTHTKRISKTILDSLRQTYVFAKTCEDDLLSLVQICDFESVPAKTTLVTEGQKSAALFVLVKGRLVVKEAITPTSELIIARIDPGDVVGEIGFFDGKVASASVRTDEASQVIRIDNTALTTLFKERPSLELSFHRAVIGTLTQRLRNSNQIIRASLNSAMMPRC